MKLSNLLIGMFALLISCEDRYQDEMPEQPVQGSTLYGPNNVEAPARIEEYTFDGTEGDPIPIDRALQWTKHYRELNINKTQAHFFGRDIINQILAQQGCVGIRLYYALDEEGKQQILLVGVNSKGNNILPSNSSRTEGDDPIIADFSYPCPSFCSSGDL